MPFKRDKHKDILKFMTPFFYLNEYIDISKALCCKWENRGSLL